MIAVRRELAVRWVWTIVGAVLLAACGCSATSGVVYNNSGKGYYQRGQFALARDEFNRAVIDDPANPDYRHNLALAMIKTGDPAGAEQVLRQNLNQVSAMHQPSYHTLSRLLVEQQRQGEAKQLVQSWSDTQPYLAQSHIELASINRELGNPVGAEQNLRQALQIDPHNSSALANLGQLYEDRGQANQAATMYQRSLASRWAQPQVQSRLMSLNTRGGASRSMSRSALMQNPVYVQPTTFASAPAPTPASASHPVVSSTPAPAAGNNSLMAAAPVLGPTPDPISSSSTTFEKPVIAGSIIPNADPAHSHSEMTVENPSIDPF